MSHPTCSEMAATEANHARLASYVDDATPREVRDAIREYATANYMAGRASGQGKDTASWERATFCARRKLFRLLGIAQGER